MTNREAWQEGYKAAVKGLHPRPDYPLVGLAGSYREGYEAGLKRRRQPKGPKQNPGFLSHAITKHKVKQTRQRVQAEIARVRNRIAELEQEVIEYRHGPIWKGDSRAKQWAAQASLKVQKLRAIEKRLAKGLQELPVINPSKRKPKFKVGDYVYSYQNEDYKARISHIHDEGISGGIDYGFTYKLALKEPGGYSKSSNWIGENSLSKRRKNGIIEAAAGLQALDYFGGKVKRAGLGKKPKFNPGNGLTKREFEILVKEYGEKAAKEALAFWCSQSENFRRGIKALPYLRANELLWRGLKKNSGDARFLLQIVTTSGKREQFTTNTEKQAREIAASWYSRGASVTVIDRKKKTQTVYGKKNPSYSFAASTKTRGRVQGVVKALTKSGAVRKVKRELQGDGVGRVVVARKNPRAKGSRDALGVFHAENPRVTKVKSVESRTGGITLRQLKQAADAGEQWAQRQYKVALASVRRVRKAERKERNPSVTDLSRTFQGEADGSIDRMYAADSAPANLARAGKLVFLKAAGRTFRLPGAMVSIAPNGKLWITGPGALFETKARKGEQLDIGEISHICYETAKAHIGNGKTYEYVHEFGEDGGKRPHLIIDSEGMPILRGGDYKIRAEGIVN